MLHEFESSTAIRAKNRAAVLQCLHINGEISRKQLASNLHLTPAAMTKIVSELLEDGLVKECGTASGNGAGRREIKLALKAEAHCALGISLGLGSAILSAVDLNGTVLFAETVPLPVRAEPEATVSLLAKRLLELLHENGVEREKILGVGVTVRGMIGSDGRSVRNSFDTFNTDGFPICERLEATLGFPALLANNVRALALAQIFCAREPQTGNSFFVHCGSGIGAALIVNGKVLHGNQDQCAEIGHIPVVRRGGKPCHCGKTGCLETVASPSAIREAAQAILSPLSTPLLWKLTNGNRAAVTTEFVLDAARGADSDTSAVVGRAVSALAGALQHVIYLFDPKEIILYGQIFEHPYYLARLTAEINIGVDAAHVVPIQKSRFNNQLETRAPGLLVLTQYLENGGTTL